MKGKNKRIALKDILKRELKDSEFSFYFEREKSISEIARLVRDARLKAGLTQAQLAKKGPKQPGRHRKIGIGNGSASTFS